MILDGWEKGKELEPDHFRLSISLLHFFAFRGLSAALSLWIQRKGRLTKLNYPTKLKKRLEKTR